MIINIFEENFCLYKNITNAENLIVKYEKLFTDVIVEKIKSKIIGNEKDIDCVVKAIECFTGRTFFPCKKINGKNLCCVFTSKKEIIFENENEKISIVCNIGNILIIGNKIISQWNFKIPNDVLLFDDTNIYSVINLNLENRFEYYKKIKYIFEYYSNKNIWEQCIKNNEDVNFLGVGGFGNVYGIKYLDGKFALKMTDASENKIKKRLYLAMKESFFLNNIVLKILANKLCPNFPLVFENFSCKDCDMKLQQKQVNVPCLINCLEFADGTLYDLLKTDPFSTEELDCFLFQVMVAIHTLQYHYQVCHFDIKKQNILYYRVNSGGFWKYTVYGKDYYIPNNGYVLILNDFGLSKIYSPKFPEWMKDKNQKLSLGTRIGIIKNGKLNKLDKKDLDNLKKFESKKIKIPFENNVIYQGGTYYLDKNLISKPTLNSIKNPLINKNYDFYKIFEDKNFPPLEFYNDTQDAIRMFTGGKKMTQKDNHKKFNLDKVFISKLKTFLWEKNETIPNEYPDDISRIFSGYFISEYFGENNIFTENKTEILEKYIIS